jgi:hypothetical protein
MNWMKLTSVATAMAAALIASPATAYAHWDGGCNSISDSSNP